MFGGKNIIQKASGKIEKMNKRTGITAFSLRGRIS